MDDLWEGESETSIFVATRQGNLQNIRDIIASGVDVDAVNQNVSQKFA